MSNIFYSISILIIGILFLIVRKSDRKIDIIPQICITFLCTLAYQTLECIFLSAVNISINLYTLLLINIIVIILLIIGIKKNGVQSFKIDKKDILVAGIFIIIVSAIGYYDFGKIENIKYYTTDASIHYIAAKEFYQNDKLLYKTEGTETATQMMPVAYVNVGLTFKALEPIIGEMNFYKVFIIFDILIFLTSALTFYFIIKNKANNKIQILLAIVITIIYLLGYPLNNLLSGFYYLGVGCLSINAILYVLGQKEYKRRLVLSLLNTAIILSYSLFAPVVYISIFIYDGFITYKKYKKILNREFIIDTLITLIVPGLIGTIYMLSPNIETVKYIAVEGYIYKSLLINILFFIPFVFYFFIQKIKNKELDYKTVYITTLIVYALILYIGTKAKLVSQYYFYKNAYILWAIIIICFYEGLIDFTEKYKSKRYIVYIYLIVYVLLGAVSIVLNRHTLSIYDIYENNRYLITCTENLNSKEIEMLKYMYDNNILSKTENNTLFIEDFMGEAWIRAIFKYRNRYPLEAGNHLKYIEKWNNGEIEYLAIFEKSKIYKICKENINLENCKLLYETSNSKLYKLNK